MGMRRYGLIAFLVLNCACSDTVETRNSSCAQGQGCTNEGDSDLGNDSSSENASSGDEFGPNYNWPDTEVGYQPGALSIITSLQLNEDTNKANFFGRLLVVLSNDSTEPDTLFNGFIENGSLVTAFEHREFVDESNNLLLAHMQGRWNENATWESVANGNAFIYLTTDSYRPNSGQPKSVFQSSQLDDSQLRAEGADMTFKLPEGDYLDAITIKEATVTCPNVRKVGDNFSYAGGVIEGYVTIDSFFSGLNASLAQRCSCLGLSREVFMETDAAGTYACNTDSGDLDACADTDDFAICEFTMNQCNLLLTLVGRGDLDRNSMIEGNDAMSFRVNFEAQPVGFSGIRNP